MSLTLQHGIYGQPAKYIKMYKDSLVAVQGSVTANKLSFCGMKIEYEQVSVNQLLVQAGAQNAIAYQPPSSYSTSAILVAMTVSYDAEATENWLWWRFEDEATMTRQLADLLVLSGTADEPVPTIYVSNDSDLPVTLNIMTAFVSSDNVSVTNDYDQVFTGLTFSSLRTVQQGESLGVYNNANTLLLTMSILGGNISNVEMADDNFIVIDDVSQGRIGLQFVTSYDQAQAMSAISWLLTSPGARTLPQSADVTAPVITFTPGVVANVAPNTALASYGGTVSSADAIAICISTLVDDRDGAMSTSALTVEFMQGTVSYESVSVAGVYNVRFSVRDTAKNLVSTTVQMTFT